MSTEKTMEKEYDSVFSDRQKTDLEENEKYLGNQLSKLPIHKTLREFF